MEQILEEYGIGVLLIIVGNAILMGMSLVLQML